MPEHKRQRSLSGGSSASSSSAASSDMDEGSLMNSPPASPTHHRPAAKYHRAPSGELTHLCVLPPTCNQPGTAQSFATLGQLEQHQTTFHRWVCCVPIRDKPGRVGEGSLVTEADAAAQLPQQFAGRAVGAPSGNRWTECGKVFPDERLLELHHTETHDPIARERQERGEKIFACFLLPDQCGKVFLTPKKRRQHLIDKHHYPIAYYFSITNHGLNQIARAEGAAASLIRPRVDRPPAPAGLGHDRRPPRPPQAGYRAMSSMKASARSELAPIAGHHPGHHVPVVQQVEDVDMDGLAAKMATMESSLAFVPRNVRRGTGGLARRREGTRMVDP